MKHYVAGSPSGGMDPIQEKFGPHCTSDASRRTFLKSVLAVGAGAFLPTSGLIAQVTSSSPAPKNGLIDVHNHFMPPSIVQELGAKRLGGIGMWTPTRALDDMGEAGVSSVVTSIAPAGDVLSDPATAVRFARECNDYAARLTSDYPGRFGLFANLPMPNIDATLSEIAYAFDTLKADGIAFYTSYGNKWLGDPAFNPVFEELNRRRAVVYTHPQTASCCKNLIPGIGDGAIEWGTDTTRAIASMVFGGAAARYPNVRMIWSHGGGSMPFLVERFTLMAQSAQMAPKFPQGFVGAAAKFYYDTAQVSNAAAMSALRKVVPMSQIVFGTDYPFRTSAEHVKGLKECGVFSAQELRLINRDNAAPLLPRFKA
jgi:predicted TIM-barrel fold metal-dependent hydrolase